MATLPVVGPSLSRTAVLARFPIRTVERLDRKLDRLVEAVGVHAPRLGVRARLVEALHPAGGAEQMLGGAGAEPVAGQRVAAGHQFKSLMRDHDVQEAGHPAHRTIAFERRDRRPVKIGLEPHRSTMTTARRRSSRTL